MTDSKLIFGRHATASHRVARLERNGRLAALDACSICLRVCHNARWIDAETAIRAFRTYERPAAPRLRPALCDDCAQLIAERRGRAHLEEAA
jgi:hypothetical protein